MRENRFFILLLKTACLGLAVLLSLEAYRLAVEEDPLGELAAVEATALPDEGGGADASPAPPAKPGSVDNAPETYAVIDASAILGSSRKPPQKPALLGIAADHAFIRAPSGQTDIVREGGDLGGVKVLRIGTNRVLIEYEGKQEELTIFSGLGSAPLGSETQGRKP